MKGWMKHNLESRLQEEISIISDDYTFTAEIEEKIESLLMKVN